MVLFHSNTLPRKVAKVALATNRGAFLLNDKRFRYLFSGDEPFHLLDFPPTYGKKERGMRGEGVKVMGDGKMFKV